MRAILPIVRKEDITLYHARQSRCPWRRRVTGNEKGRQGTTGDDVSGGHASRPRPIGLATACVRAYVDWIGLLKTASRRYDHGRIADGR